MPGGPAVHHEVRCRLLHGARDAQTVSQLERGRLERDNLMLICAETGGENTPKPAGDWRRQPASPAARTLATTLPTLPQVDYRSA